MRVNRIILCAALLGVTSTYFARIPGMSEQGPPWLFSYFPSLFGTAFVAAFACIPAACLFFLERAFSSSSLSVSLAFIGMVATNFWYHSGLDLAADAQAAIG